MTDTFTAEQGADGEAVEDLENDIFYESGQHVYLVAGLLHFEECVVGLEVP